MSERKLCHEAHAACPAVSAVNVFAHAGGELQSGLYTRSKIPESRLFHLRFRLILDKCVVL